MAPRGVKPLGGHHASAARCLLLLGVALSLVAAFAPPPVTAALAAPATPIASAAPTVGPFATPVPVYAPSGSGFVSERVAVVPPTPQKVKPEQVKPAPIVSRKPTYQGRNYLWFPSLGIHHAVSWYACSASYALSYAAVYRWGCAGANNVYLMAHAGGIFGPLYTAYYAGRLKAGMLVVYADGDARIHYFRLQWWKTIPPAGDVSSWAYDAQPVSSLTLQTCVGPDSSLRLVARFVEQT